MKTINVEDIATVFVSEFIKQNTWYNRHSETRIMDNFLKLPYDRRRKLVRKTLEKMGI